MYVTTLMTMMMMMMINDKLNKTIIVFKGTCNFTMTVIKNTNKIRRKGGCNLEKKVLRIEKGKKLFVGWRGVLEIRTKRLKPSTAVDLIIL